MNSTIKKKDLEFILLTILTYDVKTSQPVSGLLMEKSSLKVKRLLQKLRSEILILFEELKHDIEDIAKEKEANPELDEKKELESLLEEEIVLKSEKPLASFIENIETDRVYDWDIIEKITV